MAFFLLSTSLIYKGGQCNKELPPIIGEAKVREFDNWKNFEEDFFACFQVVVHLKSTELPYPQPAHILQAFPAGIAEGLFPIQCHFAFRIFHDAAL